MIPGLPQPVALPEPPGSPVALGAVIEELASAGFHAGLTTHLLEPAVGLPGWQGADAAVAAAELGAALAVAAELQGAVVGARARLLDHHELWLDVLSRIVELRERQREQFAAAGARLAVLVAADAGSTAAAAGSAPGARALVDALEEDDAVREAEHRALLQSLAADAARTRAVLAAAVRPLGATGRRGQAAAVTARLAARLPGWGSGALAGMGARAAGELSRPGPAESLAAAVARWRPYASLPGFADGLVGRLGPQGITWLLSVLAGLAGAAGAGPLAALLADALSSTGHRSGSRVEEVLGAVQLDPNDPDGAVDRLALGMGLVLSAPGAGAHVAARWGGQALAREAARGTRPGTGAAGAPDPVDAALAVLVRSGDAAAAASLLAEPAAWMTLLSRQWPGGTDDLASVVRRAASAPEAGRAARSALLGLGQGLAPDGGGRVLDDGVALAGVRTAVTGLVAGQPGVLLPVLDAAATGSTPGRADDTALRGLGYLVADRGSAAEVTAAVRAALRAGDAGDLAGEVAGAHVAVLEYGQRLRHALDWSQEQSRAVDAEMVWTFGVSLPVSLVGGSRGELAGAAEDVLADALGANGDVEIGPDAGQVRTAADAARFAVQSLGEGSVPGAAHPVREAARLGFDRTGSVLGRLAAPEESFLDRLDDLPLPDSSLRPHLGG